jgi:cytochrome c peroxidase
MSQSVSGSRLLLLATVAAAGAGAAAAAVALSPAPGRAPALERAQNRSAVTGEVRALRAARHDFTAEATPAQSAPPLIPQDQSLPDPGGAIETYQSTGATVTASNAFFQNLGTNGRTCFSCHQPDQGWSVSAVKVRARFAQSYGWDPIFRPVDGATCPTADTSTYAKRVSAYRLLLAQGLIRIGLPLPAGAEFSIPTVADPYGCNTNPATGLTSPTSGIVSVYRRPLPSTNLRVLTTVMWDGREGGLLPPPSAPPGQPSLAADLSQQAIDATTGHAQGAAPTPAQVTQIVDFEMGLSTAQSYDQAAGPLNAGGAQGGAVAAAALPFFVGVNDPMGQNPTGAAFSSVIFGLYDAWTGATGGDAAAARAAVARGQALFNTRPIRITGVGGLNDVLGQPVVSGFCGTCHDAPGFGNHSIKAPLNIGVAGAGPDAPPALNTAALPVFAVRCSVATVFRPANTTFYVTDLGRATLSGKCADVAKFKGPVLRGLAARAPYFHNGSAAGLADVVAFYNARFGMRLSARERADLAAFLATL